MPSHLRRSKRASHQRYSISSRRNRSEKRDRERRYSDDLPEQKKVSSDKGRYVTRLASYDRRGDRRKYSCTFSSSAGSMHRSKRDYRHYKSRDVSKSVMRGSFQRDVSSSSQSCSSRNHVIKKTLPKAKKERSYLSKCYDKEKRSSPSKDAVKRRYAPIYVNEFSHGRGVFSDKWATEKRSPKRRHLTEGFISSYSTKYNRQANPLSKKYDTSRRGTFYPETVHPSSPKNRFAHIHSNNASPPSAPLIAPIPYHSTSHYAMSKHPVSRSHRFVSSRPLNVRNSFPSHKSERHRPPSPTVWNHDQYFQMQQTDNAPKKRPYIDLYAQSFDQLEIKEAK
ncbi:uncharacterized protein LOC128882623 [Hylaeus volcanicus]|uniref:uncharacterized protein LOC128882623 n=1 Tax=Hylaeus volcanicus TaxID=313075 RepID=UPI0023B7C546|nr:uncharacterized protein LOC128882623 [Hylaeus volcanicus]